MSLMRQIILSFSLVIVITCESVNDNGVIPLKYRLHYIFDDCSTPLESYEGNVSIEFKLTTNTKYLEIVYHGTVDHIQIKNLNDSTVIRDLKVSVNHDRHRIEWNDTTFVKLNDVYEMWLNFTEIEYGRELEKLLTDTGSPIVYTSDLQIGFPKFDARHDHLKFELLITHSSRFTVISNMPGTRTEIDGKNNQTMTLFDETPFISSNLFGFVVGEFKPYQIKNQRNFPLLMYGPESKISNFIGKIFSAYETYLDFKFPAPKLDIITIPKLTHTIMKFGLILVDEELLFSNRMDPRNVFVGINEVSKKIGDIILGNLIEEPNITWINKGIASYLADRMLHSLQPDIEHIVALTDLHDTMSKEYEIADFDLAQDIDHHKSAALFRMIEHVIGEENFRNCLQTALKSKQNFINLVTKSFEGQMNYSKFMDDWTHHKGYPIVKIDRDYDTGQIRISQRALDPTSNATWFVPYNFATQTNPNFNKTSPDDWLVGLNKTITLDVEANRWIISNKQAIGYYFVSYDEQNLNLIIDELINGSLDKIHPLNRANLLSTGYILTQSKSMADKTYLRLISYLKRENDPRPWFVADNILERLHIKSYDRNKPYVDHLTNTILSISKPLYDNYTIGINPLTRYIAMKWACRAGHAKCLTDINQVSSAYVESIEAGTTIKMPPDLMDLMLCHGFHNESDYIKLYGYETNEFRQMIKNRIDCHLNTDVFRLEFMKSFIFKMFNYRTYFDQINWMDYLESRPNFSYAIGDLIFEVFEKNSNEFDALYSELSDTELKLLPFKYISELLARHKKWIEFREHEFNRTRFEQLVDKIKRKYGEIAAESIVV